MAVNQGNAKFLDRKVVFPGQRIINQGEVGNKAYLIESGKVEITKTDAAGNEAVIAVIGRGAIFGEMALIDNEPRSASARAAEETVVVAVSRDAFDAKLQKADPFIRGLLNILVSRLRSK